METAVAMVAGMGVVATAVNLAVLMGRAARAVREVATAVAFRAVDAMVAVSAGGKAVVVVTAAAMEVVRVVAQMAVAATVVVETVVVEQVDTKVV